MALFVQQQGQGLHAKGTACANTLDESLEHQPYGFRLDRVVGKALFRIRSALFRFDDFLPVRGGGAVPETLTRIFQHCPLDMLSIFLGLVFVIGREHPADQDVPRTCAQRLCDTQNFTPCICGRWNFSSMAI